MQTPDEIACLERAFADLGVSPRDISAVQRMPWPQAKSALDALKAKARKNFHLLALTHHPDKNGGDAVKTEHFKLLARVRSDLELLEFQAPPPAPRPVPMHPIGVNPFPHAHPGGFPSSGNATFVTTTTWIDGAIRVVLIRI